MPPTTQQTATTIFYRNIRWLKFVDRLGKKGAGILEYLGGLGTMAAQTAHAAITRPIYGSEIVAQMDELGVKSLSITGITAFSVGMVLALQTAYSLAAFGGKMFTGRVVAISLVRELGPVLTALMVGGRVGSGITAELGSMTVTEQVDALRSMAISPIRRLVLPRVLAVVIMLPILTAIADVLGILGGLLIAVVDLQLTTQDYLNSIWQAMAIQDITSGLAKTFFFGLAVALIGCYNGLKVEGGAAAVGQATTRDRGSRFDLRLIVRLLPDEALPRAMSAERDATPGRVDADSPGRAGGRRSSSSSASGSATAGERSWRRRLRSASGEVVCILGPSGTGKSVYAPPHQRPDEARRRRRPGLRRVDQSASPRKSSPRSGGGSPCSSREARSSTR